MKPASENKENKMGTMKIPYLLFNMACPLTVSLMVQAMYNIIDSLFISRLGRKCSGRYFSGSYHTKPDEFYLAAGWG